MATVTRTPGQTLSMVIGVVYLLIGIVGFFVVQQFTGNTDQTLIAFELNGLHNVVHLLIGIAGIALARTASGARTYGMALLVAYGLVAIYGFVAVRGPESTEAILSLNQADNWLHILSAILGGVIIAMSGRGATTRTA